MKTIVKGMEYSMKLDRERQSLVDFIAACNGRINEHFGYVIDYLRGNDSRLMTVLRHAEDLPNKFSRNYENSETLVQKLTEHEVPIVKKYLSALNDYLKGQPFQSVREAARDLCFSKPVPSTIRAPPCTFSKELIEAYELV